MHLPRRLLVSLFLILSACDSTVGLPGVWTGVLRTQASFLGPARAYSFTMTLTETEQGVVSGNGRLANSAPDSLNAPSNIFALNVTGAHAHPAIGLAIAPVGVQSMNFSGMIDATLSRMDGVVYGSGFSGDSLRLFRNTPAVAGRLTAP